MGAAGPDLHLAVEDDRGNGWGNGREDGREDGRGVVVLDTRLMTGWELVPVRSGGLTVPVREFKGAKESAGVQEGLF